MSVVRSGFLRPLAEGYFESRVGSGTIVSRALPGLAAGPHLDFRIERHGQFLNFERLPLPPSQPVARRDMAEFVAVRDRKMALLPQVSTSSASSSSTSPSVVLAH